MQRLVASPRAYRWLDAAQLVKHAFGLAYTFPDRPTTLLYVFWEPSNPEVHPVFSEHRAELEVFATAVAGDTPRFAAISYPELWQEWSRLSEPEWLKPHVGRLRARYEISIERPTANSAPRLLGLDLFDGGSKAC